MFSASPDSFLSPKLHSPHTAKSRQLCLQTRREPGPRSPPHRRHPPRPPSSLACDRSGLPASALAGFAHTSAIARSRPSLTAQSAPKGFASHGDGNPNAHQGPQAAAGRPLGARGPPRAPCGLRGSPQHFSIPGGAPQGVFPARPVESGGPPPARPPWRPPRGAQHRLALVSLAAARLPPPGRALGEGRSLCWLQYPRRANGARHSAGAEGTCRTPPGGQRASTS